MDEVKAKVIHDLSKDKRNQKAAKDAGLFLEALKGGASMITEARRRNLRLTSTGFFKRNAEIPGIGYEKGITQEAFKLSGNQPLPESIIKGSSGYYVIRFKDRNEPGIKEFTAQKKDIVQRILDQKKSDTFDTWLETVKRNSEIEIEENFQNLL